MIINVDAKALDWLCSIHLSKDPVAGKEWQDNIDQHTLNVDVLRLPSRLVAKKFLFRCIFWGSAYAYTIDPDFMGVSTNQKFWQGVIDRFWDKYKVLYDVQNKWISQATLGKPITIPTGRQFMFERVQNKHTGEWEWPKRDIACHPIQGLEGELMKVYRIMVQKRMAEFRPAVLFSTVHDSLAADAPEEYVIPIRDMFQEEAAKMGQYLKEFYGFDLGLDFRVECSRGSNLKELEEF